jgi:hypothetical protein
MINRRTFLAGVAALATGFILDDSEADAPLREIAIDEVTWRPDRPAYWDVMDVIYPDSVHDLQEGEVFWFDGELTIVVEAFADDGYGPGYAHKPILL